MEIAKTAVQLTMTLRVQKLAVSCAVVPAEDLWDDVVAVPARLPRDQETASRALSALRSPQVEQDRPTRKSVGHVPAFALLKVHLPCLDLAQVKPVHVAAFVELQLKTQSKPTVKVRLAALRMLFDWMVVGQVLPPHPRGARSEAYAAAR